MVISLNLDMMPLLMQSSTALGLACFDSCLACSLLKFLDAFHMFCCKPAVTGQEAKVSLCYRYESCLWSVRNVEGRKALRYLHHHILVLKSCKIPSNSSLVVGQSKGSRKHQYPKARQVSVVWENGVGRLARGLEIWPMEWRFHTLALEHLPCFVTLSIICMLT